MISALLGGIGLFLLGMLLMTDALRAAVGSALGDLLGRFTGGPLKAFGFGAATTMLVQSSSATVVMTIGFVSAGLLTFSQAIGVVFGASVGTTSTSWLVAFLGLRYSVSVAALPLVGIGVVVRLLGRGRTASTGMFVAGFGLFLVGIDTLQGGMASLSERIDLAGIEALSVEGRLMLVATGIVMTIIMQSSTAAVATTLAALHAGTIDLTQAAALVIGQNVGTTFTAAIASIGASVPARRTALSHILLNSISGLIAFVLMPITLRGLEGFGGVAGLGAPPLIAVFHTGINLVGVGLLLPVTNQFGRLISKLIPERGPELTQYLDTTLLSVPGVAIDAARRTVVKTLASLLSAARAAMAGRPQTREDEALLARVAEASAKTRDFLGRIRTSPDEEREHRRHLAVLHASDHLDRLLEALRVRPSPSAIFGEEIIQRVATGSAAQLEPVENWLHDGAVDEPPTDVEALSRSIAEERRTHRPFVMERTASGEISPEVGLRVLDAMRWVDRAVYHIWRSVHHLGPEGEREGAHAVEEYLDAPDHLESTQDGTELERSTSG